MWSGYSWSIYAKVPSSTKWLPCMLCHPHCWIQSLHFITQFCGSEKQNCLDRNCRIELRDDYPRTTKNIPCCRESITKPLVPFSRPSHGHDRECSLGNSSERSVLAIGGFDYESLAGLSVKYLSLVTAYYVYVKGYLNTYDYRVSRLWIDREQARMAKSRNVGWRENPSCSVRWRQARVHGLLEESTR